VVHSLPGRIRVRIDRSDVHLAPELAARLATHRAVQSTRWLAAARSLTIHYDPAEPFLRIVGGLPDSVALSPDGHESPGQSLWRQFLLPAVSLVAAFSGLGLIARVVIAACALPIVRRSAGSLLARRLSIDVLDSIAVALLLGIGDALAAGVSVALIESGERIRRRASGRARRVLRSWMGADPRGVRLQLDGTEPRIALSEVAIGARAVVYPGETVPVDGIVVAGTGSLDSQTWTGEPIPHDIAIGETVLAGSSLSDGRLVIQITAKGDQTRAGRLATALEDAIAADTNVADLARRIADRFVAPVLLAGAAVFVLTGDLTRLISILIMDFGTGVRISIPTTILTTMVSGARHGVLFKNGRSIEQLASVDTVVFDKTGTLTAGKPSVRELVPEPGADTNEILRLAAAAEGHLPHPIARAIRGEARRRRLDLPQPDDVRYQRGGGVVATVGRHRVVVGDKRLLRAHSIAIPESETTDSSTALVAVDGSLALRIKLHDRLKDKTRPVMEELRAAGVRSLWLATGDHRAAAAAVARQLGLDGFHAGLMPEDKVALVRRERATGRVVAVVGDGINDAAALAEANVGIAVQRGADMVRETADIVLLGEDLAGLVAARRLSQAAMGIVRQNIALVAGPNGIGLGLAVLGRLPPIGATVLNNGSTILGAANALRPLAGRGG
jgi:Cu2+-exporting ATPase